MRIWNDPKSVTVQSQISNSIYEIANAESGQDHEEPKAKTPKAPLSTVDNILNLTQKLKPLLDNVNPINNLKQAQQIAASMT
jgi:hypothetical protein